jgi:hypothetical protein
MHQSPYLRTRVLSKCEDFRSLVRGAFPTFGMNRSCLSEFSCHRLPGKDAALQTPTVAGTRAPKGRICHQAGIVDYGDMVVIILGSLARSPRRALL